MKRRYQLEQERAQRQMWALEARRGVHEATRREVMDPAQAAQMAKMLGKASSQTEAVNTQNI